jgi:hypothetical protein
VAETPMTTLRTGVSVNLRAALAVWVNIQAVWQLNPVAIVEAAQIARWPDYRVPDSAEVALLKRWAILEPGGGMHDIDRELVLAATIEEGTEFTLVWPFAGEAPG